MLHVLGSQIRKWGWFRIHLWGDPLPVRRHGSFDATILRPSLGTDRREVAGVRCCEGRRCHASVAAILPIFLWLLDDARHLAC